MSNSPELRPMGLAELLDAAMRSFRGRFFALVGVAALAQMPLALAQLLFWIPRREGIMVIGFVTSPLSLAFVPFPTANLSLG